MVVTLSRATESATTGILAHVCPTPNPTLFHLAFSPSSHSHREALMTWYPPFCSFSTLKHISAWITLLLKPHLAPK